MPKKSDEKLGLETSEPIWVREDVVLAIHRRQLSEHGGGEGVRDAGLLSSALGKPKNLYTYSNPAPSMARLAASYAFGLAKNHPFVDGNKRTAFIVCQLFLNLNGWKLDASALDKFTTFLDLAAGQVSEDELTAWLEAHVVRVEG